MPYINGQFIFPAIIATAIILLSVWQKDILKTRLHFSGERKIDAIAALIPANFDTAAVAGNLEKHLATITETDSLFIKFSSAVSSTAAPAIKWPLPMNLFQTIILSSKTAKISLTIFWLLMVGLSLLAFVKKYSLIPLLGVSTCLYLLTGMTLNNWLWFSGWLLLGLVIYFLYGYKKSRLADRLQS